MRYEHSKEQSAEFLRLALPLMAAQEAALHPISYTLWYEHVAAINSELSAALTARLEARTPVREEDVYELYARYIMPSDREVLDRLCEKFCTLIEETTQTSTVVAESTGRYKQALEESRTRLAEAVSLENVRGTVTELISETLRMESTAQTASERLDERTQKLRLLTEQLELARAEALLDPLTGLRNRRGFERAIEEVGGIGGAALVVADIDHFKQINDTHGHLLGDKAVRAIGRILHESVKRRDLVGRWGGEEFTVLLLNTSVAGAQIVAEQIRASVERLRIRKVDGTELERCLTISLGVAVAQASEGFDNLMRRADAALYRAKREGRNACASRSPELLRPYIGPRGPRSTWSGTLFAPRLGFVRATGVSQAVREERWAGALTALSGLILMQLPRGSTRALDCESRSTSVDIEDKLLSFVVRIPDHRDR
jgi:diguanylate cyclase